MKKLFLMAMSFALTSMLFTSCSNDEEFTPTKQQVEKTVPTKYVDFVLENRDVLIDYMFKSEEEPLTRASMEAVNDIHSTFGTQANEFCKEMDIQESDLKEMFEIKTEKDMEEAQIATMMYAVALEKVSDDATMYTVDGYEIVSDKVKECFLEVTNIAAGVTIIATLTKGAVSKATIKAAIKLAAKIGGKTLSQIGLIIMVAEFINCIY